MKPWPREVSRAFEALSLPQKFESDALQPSRGPEIFVTAPWTPGGCGLQWGGNTGLLVSPLEYS